MLHVAADKEKSTAALKVLSLPDAKSLLEMADEDGCTALHYAAHGGRLEIVTALLKAGAIVEVSPMPRVAASPAFHPLLYSKSFNKCDLPVSSG